ncbi:dTDP-4-dehydrorhamnose reductase [Algoriphagus sp. H41]|uniref:dTDP-4-dehydrorhamnose reductase n=1 Tax=Algoriphagus oliviformis TaxID=2811231 RepID=A0ABS3C9N2_9BACT|nr:dTDP-4-dehydrorhamnose reductase [Algoriphagus oliviformis]MBN7812875.1 dTDP-4-dehydrorhamnose reductase [Algoriphagus oliviformis]
MNKILVTGASGQLGSEIRHLSSQYPFEFIFTDVAELDITDEQAVRHFFETNKPNAVVNCAAYTAVDRAEEDIETADKINHLAVKYLAQAAQEYGAKLVHVSTDYVFDGNGHRPYDELATPDPQSVYGDTKLKGERAIIELGIADSAIVRTSWVYSTFGNNFVKTMRRLGAERSELNVVADQVGTPTYARDLAAFILDMLPDFASPKTELFHFSNEGVCSWYDFALAVMEMSGLDCKVKPIPSEKYPTPAKRPFYSVMSKEKAKAQLGVEIGHWRDALQRCIGEM